jgi:hypothetical protein
MKKEENKENFSRECLLISIAWSPWKLIKISAIPRVPCNTAECHPVEGSTHADKNALSADIPIMPFEFASCYSPLIERYKRIFIHYSIPYIR